MRKIITPLLALVVVTCLPPPHADAVPGNVVISEVYGGGGNANAKYSHDYVELFNRTRGPIDLTGWTVGYSSKSSSTWTSLALRGSIASYHYFLVRLGTAGGGGAAVPTPDATGATNIARSAGKIRLSNSSGVVDLVGYGGANAAEGRPAAAPTDNTHSVTRISAGCTDTDRNDKDFRVRTPGPRNRASHGYACGTAPMLAPIGSKSVVANQALTFMVSATDAERDPLTYSAAPLPSGAVFTPSTRTFEWTPTQEQVGSHGVVFRVSDGSRSDTETVRITVSADPYVGRSQITLDVTSDTRRLFAAGRVAPSHPGAPITVRLFRREVGGYRRIAVVKTPLDQNSAYRASFKRPGAGRCIVNATFHGDADHPPATEERVVGC